MTTDIWVGNLAAYAVQSTVLIAAGAALARVLRIQPSRAALGYWRALLLGCLLLPVCQPWNPPPAHQLSRLPAVTDGVWQVREPRPVTLAASRQTTAWPVDRVVFLVLAAGVAARGAWLLGGAWGLRRLRRGASPLSPLPPWIHDAEARVGARADICVSSRVGGPITFGLFNPVIILPPSVLALDAPVQEAIACHELLHVRRRDWIDEIAEEVVRTLLWFHPAARWLIGRIQLSREQAVDRAVVEITHSTERYVNALLAVALAKTRIGLLPAPLFLRRRFLKTRIVSILQETAMSKRQLVLSLAASAAVLACAAAASVRWFPLQARGQASNGQPVQMVAGGEGVLHARLPEYPRRAIERRIEGDVMLELTLDDKGSVSDARILAGPEELRKAALQAALDWHYSPTAARAGQTRATIRFTLPSEEMKLKTATEEMKLKLEAEARQKQIESGKIDVVIDGLSPGQRAERVMKELEKGLQDPSLTNEQRDELKMKYALTKAELDQSLRIEPGKTAWAVIDDGNVKVFTAKLREEVRFDGAPVLTQIRSERLSDEVRADLVKSLGVRLGDRIDEETAKRIRAAVARVDEHLRVLFEGDGKGGIVLMIVAP